MARNFNGTSDQATVTGATDLTGNWTVGGWFYWDGTVSTGVRAFYSRWTNSSTARQLYVYMNFNGGNNHHEIHVDVPFISAIMSGTTDIQANTWYSWAVTRNSNSWVLYLNGAQEATASNAAAQESNTTINIGYSSADGASVTWPGRIAHTFTSTNVWTALEANAFKQGELPQNIRGGSGLVGYWPFFGFASPEPDLSGKAINASLTGTLFASGPPVKLFTPLRPFILPNAGFSSNTSGTGTANATDTVTAITAALWAELAEADGIASALGIGSFVDSSAHGPMTGAIGATVLAPSGTFSKEKYLREIDRIRTDAIAALAAIPSRDGLSELDIAELDLSDANRAFQAASEALKTDYSRKTYEQAEDARSALRELEGRVGQLRIEDAKARALKDAKDHIRKQIRDRIAAIRKWQ